MTLDFFTHDFWVAMDSDGAIYAYDQRPRAAERDWVVDSHSSLIHIESACSMSGPALGWKSSLRYVVNAEDLPAVIDDLRDLL